MELSEFRRGIQKLQLVFGEKFTHASDEESLIKIYELFGLIKGIPDIEYLSAIERIIYFGTGPYRGISLYALIRENMPSVVEEKSGPAAWKEVFLELDRIKNIEPPFFCDVITQSIVGEWSWTELRQSLIKNSALARFRIEFIEKYEQKKMWFSDHLSLAMKAQVMESLDQIEKRDGTHSDE
ncbi:MAG: hypothetical protein ACYDBP_04550 [Leptospirales bacterium]